MDRKTEIGLIKECLELADAKTTQLGDNAHHVPVDYYTSTDRFDQEMKKVFNTSPLYVAHENELPKPGSYIAKKWINNFPLLVLRGKDGVIRAFANVCRHRGARLVEEGAGCKKAFSCPYHAWTYGDDGRLVGAPEFNTGFPDMDKKDLHLIEMPCKVIEGMIFVHPDRKAMIADDFIPENLVKDLQWMDFRNLVPYKRYSKVWNCNWKLLTEGGIEAYHFKVAHANTIAPFFIGNCSTWQAYNRHTRSVLPKTTLMDAKTTPEDSWNIRDMSNVLYGFFPNVSLLVQPDHVGLVYFEPVAADKTLIDVITMAPPPANGEDYTDEEQKLWDTNFRITSHTLIEDFELGEGIQESMASGALEEIHFGRFESCLTAFHGFYNEAMKA